MPRELIADRPGHTVLREYDEAPLKSDQVRAKSLFSAVKHGTEFRGFQANTLDASDVFSWEWRMHLRGQKTERCVSKTAGQYVRRRSDGRGARRVKYSGRRSDF